MSEYLKSVLERTGDNFYFCTIHRAENTDDTDRMKGIMKALEKISENTPVILPIHPRTRKILADMGESFKNVIICDPVSYFDMITLLEKCHGVFTDSGGLQKEAFFFGKYCVTLRDETEWVELVENGFNSIAGADTETIFAGERRIHDASPDWSLKLYGEGDAGERIVHSLAHGLS